MTAGIKGHLRRALGRAAPLAWRGRRKPSLAILTYHRVLPADHPDRRVEQPGMYVIPDTLAMHIAVLKRHFDLVDLGEWLHLRAAGARLPDRACCITFDDGWRDNFEYALPVLKAALAPATVFLVSDFVGAGYSFWPNRLARLLVGLDAREFAGLSQDLRQLLADTGFVPGQPAGSPEHPWIDRVINRCKARSDESMIALLDEAEKALGKRDGEGPRDLLDAAEVRALRDSGLVRFGSHSRRHTRLRPDVPAPRLDDEVRGSRSQLEQLVGQPVEIFCYPNGDYSAAALDAVRHVYEAAVTTVPGWNYPDSDVHLLRRLSVHQDIAADSDSFLARVARLR